MQARARAGARRNAFEPPLEVFGRGGDRLACARGEIRAAIKNDVGDGEALGHNPIASSDQSVEPIHPILCELLERSGRLGKTGMRFLNSSKPSA